MDGGLACDTSWRLTTGCNHRTGQLSRDKRAPSGGPREQLEEPARDDQDDRAEYEADASEDRDAANRALCRDNGDARADARDHQVADIVQQALALVPRKRQKLAELAYEDVAVAQHDEQREEHREQTRDRRHEIGHDGSGAGSQE